jgi:hypothetical protein
VNGDGVTLADAGPSRALENVEVIAIKRDQSGERGPRESGARNLAGAVNGIANAQATTVEVPDPIARVIVQSDAEDVRPAEVDMMRQSII